MCINMHGNKAQYIFPWHRESISYKPVYHDGLSNYHEHTKCLNVSLYSATFIVCFLHVNSLILYDRVKKNFIF